MRGKKNFKLVNMLKVKGSNQRELARLLGCSYTSICNRIAGYFDFMAAEIKIIKEHYQLTPEEVNDIFFED